MKKENRETIQRAVGMIDALGVISDKKTADALEIASDLLDSVLNDDLKADTGDKEEQCDEEGYRKVEKVVHCGQCFFWNTEEGSPSQYRCMKTGGYKVAWEYCSDGDLRKEEK